VREYVLPLQGDSSIEIPQPGLTIEIEVAGVLGKGFIRKPAIPRIIDLQGIKFRIFLGSRE